MHITLKDAPAHHLDGIVGRSMAVPSRGSKELAVWTLSVDPGVGGQPHTVTREEVFLLNSGRMSMTIDGRTYDLEPGDAALVPPDTMFSLANTGDEIAHLTVCTSAGIEATLNGVTVKPAWAQ